MHLQGLLSAVMEADSFQSLHAQLVERHPVASQNIPRAARPYVVAALAQQLQRPLLIVTDRVARAYNMAEQIPVWLPEVEITRFNEPTAAFYERIPWAENTIRTRLETLGQLFSATPDSPPIVVTSALALMQKTMPLREFRLGWRRLRVGSRFEPDKLMRLWLELGYDPVTIVTQHGQFSRRGGILDVFPPTEPYPVRLEFFDDEIESLRSFDPASQRSLEKVSEMSFSPTREALPKYGKPVAEALADWFAQQPDDDTSAKADYDMLAEGRSFPTLEFYLPWMYEQAGSLLKYLPDDTLVVVDDWQTLRDSIEDLEEQALELREDKIQRQELPPEAPLAYHTWDEIYDQLTERHLLHLAQDENPSMDSTVGDLFTPGPRYGGQIRTALEEIGKLRNRNTQVIVVTRQAEHVSQIWAEAHSYIVPIENITTRDVLGLTNFVEGELTEGWILTTDQALHLYTDAEIFGWKRPEPRRRHRPRAVAPEAVFADLSEGDFIVHVEYGVGRFGGLIRREFEGTYREFLKLEYADNDTLFVPIHQAERITPYVGADDSPPKLNRLGTQEWHRIRKKASEAAEKVAEELLALYAARSLVPGYAFGPDTPWQHELEASFPYVETEDQLKALRDVKQDMEMPHPMDRLICGDVGYGKTEIALRAAFKATMDGKQVAILVPTTILAQQHFNTFSKRLEKFPVEVEMLSRFRTDAEQAQIMEGLTDGTIDVVIGTHRLLGQDIRFKDLGLLVIDEEQRFGITHKERLKQMRNEVDVLTLTATPIPRTLYMSITGVRDISIIQTAPEERLPVATHVGTYDERLVRQAILRELDRGGQIFFVHNRVQSIETVAGTLRELVPEASIVVGHGQMADAQLERVMTAFANAEYDVLVSTSIIENGLDIPNANTIIIDRADWFGLAEMYQLRGRVGRSANQGYAYFFHPSYRRLTDDAKARLETIGEETQLGAGLAIAMRDLEIRGAGDLLGKRQSGHIAAVGFNLYTQLLSQAVQKLKQQTGIKTKSEAPLPTPPLVIDLPLATYIPSEYIPETALRIQLYRRLSDLTTVEQIQEMRDELADRFGPLPQAVDGLLFQLEVKVLAAKARATAIVHEQSKIGIKLPYLGKIDRNRLQNILGEQSRVSRTAIWLSREGDDWMVALLALLETLAYEAVPTN